VTYSFSAADTITCAAITGSGLALNGPWTYVEYPKSPPGFRKYKVERLRDYREREYVVYRQQAVKGPQLWPLNDTVTTTAGGNSGQRTRQ
jgi:hypothetical protein